MSSIYFFHGYLSEKTDLDYGPFGPIREDQNYDHEIFVDKGKDIAALVDGPVYMVNYPTNWGFIEWLKGEISTARFFWREAWYLSDAVEDIDEYCQEFGEELEQKDEEPILIGHSMGGRAVLKIREYAPVRTIAMAPAISEAEISWDRIDRYDEQVELFYSEHDAMTGLYGTRWVVGWGENIGVGQLPDELPNPVRAVDVSRKEDGTKRGHGDFMDVDKFLPEHSKIFRSII